MVLLLSFTSLSIADQVTLQWDANSEIDLAGHRLYWGDESRNYIKQVDVGNVTQYTIDIPNNTYIAATAYNINKLESGYSNEVFYQIIQTIFPATNGQLNYKIIIVEDDEFIDTEDDKYLDTVIDEFE